MAISAWWLFVVALPVLWLGELLVRRVGLLSRFSIPVPVVGGLLVALVVLGVNLAGVELAVKTSVDAKWWMWIVTPETKLADAKPMTVYQPLIVAFFTLIGLNASWAVAKKGSWQLLLFLCLASTLALCQSLVGVGMSRVLEVSPLLGLLCGSVSMTGGHGTALGMASTFEAAGLANAKVIGAAAATFGLVSGSLLGGPLASVLIRRRGLRPTTWGGGMEKLNNDEQMGSEIASGEGDGFAASRTGFVGELKGLWAMGRTVLVHGVVLLVCMKVGAWVSLGLVNLGLTFPVYIGAMLVGIAVRNIADVARPPGKGISTAVVEALSSVMLGLFLAMAMVSLNLIQLVDVAGPMAVILAAQVGMMAVFAWLVTFNVMGRDYDAAVMAGGHCGFGLGATPNAVANMEAITRRFWPSPRAFLVVTIVGGFLIDFMNSMVITGFLNVIRG